MTLHERLRRAHLVLAIHEDDHDRRTRLAQFFSHLDPDLTCRQLDQAARHWDDSRYQAEQIIAELINTDKEARA